MFRRLFAMMFFSMIPAYYISQVAKSLGIELGGYDDIFLTTVVSIGSIFNGSSKIIIGILQDYVGFKPLYQAIMIL